MHYICSFYTLWVQAGKKHREVVQSIPGVDKKIDDKINIL